MSEEPISMEQFFKFSRNTDTTDSDNFYNDEDGVIEEEVDDEES